MVLLLLTKNIMKTPLITALLSLLMSFITLPKVSQAKSACGSLLHVMCNRTYQKVGGFHEKSKNRAIPELLLNDRDCFSKKNFGHKLDWRKFTASIHSLACRCADKAREKGYKVFGLQFFGECWSGPTAELTYAKYGKAHLSKSYQFIGNPPPPCNETLAQECVGGALINYVYRLKEDCKNLLSKKSCRILRKDGKCKKPFIARFCKLACHKC